MDKVDRTLIALGTLALLLFLSEGCTLDRPVSVRQARGEVRLTQSVLMDRASDKNTTVEPALEAWHPGPAALNDAIKHRQEEIDRLVREANALLKPLFSNRRRRDMLESPADLDAHRQELLLQALRNRAPHVAACLPTWASRLDALASRGANHGCAANTEPEPAAAAGTAKTKELTPAEAAAVAEANVLIQQARQLLKNAEQLKSEIAHSQAQSGQDRGSAAGSSIGSALSATRADKELAARLTAAIARAENPPVFTPRSVTSAASPVRRATRAGATESGSPSAGLHAKTSTANLDEGKLKPLQHVTRGSVGISAPARAIVDAPFTLIMKVGTAQLGAILADLAAEIPENATRTGADGVKLTPRMSASLTGIGFEISPSGSISQPVLMNESTTWQWQAKAKEAGSLSLSFTLSQTLLVQGKEVARNVQFRKTVQVDVKPFDVRAFTAANWQWMMSILLIPLAKLGWDIYMKSRKPAAIP